MAEVKTRKRVKAELPKEESKAVETKAVELKTTEVKSVAVMNPPKDVFSLEIVKELDKRAKTIRTELGKVESSFLKIGFNLTWIYENGSFKALGYDTIYDLAKKEFNIARGTCNNFINVVQRFGVRLDDNTIGYALLPEFKDFKSSQLIQMLGMSDEELKAINKDMSVRDIKKLKKGNNSDALESTDSNDSVSDTAADDTNVIDVECKEVFTNVVLEITKDDLKEATEAQKHVKSLLSAKAQVILKLLEQGHKIQIIDIVK